MLTKPLSWFLPDPNQPRKSFAQNELHELAESMKAHGQLQPVGAKPDGALLWGGRRLLAAQLAGIKELAVIITDKPLSDTEVRIIQLSENMQRSNLTDAEVYRAVKELRELNPTWSKKDYAALLHKDASMITRIFAVDDLIPEAREVFLAGAFGFSVAYSISKASEEQQHLLLAATLSGVSREEIERRGRAQRNGVKLAVKMAKVIIAIPNQVSVVLSGNSLGMTEVVEILGAALKEARKSADQYDVKTFQSMMRDRARVISKD
jgi:ParB/RepB/Spo0J family partition protein